MMRNLTWMLVIGLTIVPLVAAEGEEGPEPTGMNQMQEDQDADQNSTAEESNSTASENNPPTEPQQAPDPLCIPTTIICVPVCYNVGFLRFCGPICFVSSGSGSLPAEPTRQGIGVVVATKLTHDKWTNYVGGAVLC